MTRNILWICGFLFLRVTNLEALNLTNDTSWVRVISADQGDKSSIARFTNDEDVNELLITLDFHKKLVTLVVNLFDRDGVLLKRDILVAEQIRKYKCKTTVHLLNDDIPFYYNPVKNTLTTSYDGKIIQFEQR